MVGVPSGTGAFSLGWCPDSRRLPLAVKLAQRSAGERSPIAGGTAALYGMFGIGVADHF
jgi:hypothetical protein